jgi:hypothetical protein
VPVSGIETEMYDAAGNLVDRVISGASQAADGTVRQTLFLWGMTPGEYTVDFSLTDVPASTASGTSRTAPAANRCRAAR